MLNLLLLQNCVYLNKKHSKTIRNIVRVARNISREEKIHFLVETLNLNLQNFLAALVCKI